MNEVNGRLPPKKECGFPSGGGIKNGYIRHLSYGGTQKKKNLHGRLLGYLGQTSEKPCVTRFHLQARTSARRIIMQSPVQFNPGLFVSLLNV